MNEKIEIRGGAGEFEAAVIAIVLDRLAAEEKAARQGAPQPGLSAWVRALDSDEFDLPLDIAGLQSRLLEPAISVWQAAL